ncbi:MAG: FkbM family methyltransferase [Beijerinckiaceae bacterium]
MRYAHARTPKEREISFLPKLVPPDRIALDVGGHTGIYSRELSKIARQVHTFEPTETYDFLSRAMPRNVTVHRLALSDHSGEATLHVPLVKDATTMATLENYHGENVRTLKVRLATLDEFFPDADIGFIKIDVEGHESAVVRGARAIIARCRPTLLIECEERCNPGGLEFLVTTFSAADYAVMFVDGAGELRPIADFKRERDQVSGQKPYINNFIFSPAERPLR